MVACGVVVVGLVLYAWYSFAYWVGTLALGLLLPTGGRGRGCVCPRVPAPSVDTERMAGSCSLPGGGVSLEPPDSHVVIHLLVVGGWSRNVVWQVASFSRLDLSRVSWFGCLLLSL